MSREHETLHLACAADSANALPLAAMLRSVAAHLDPESTLRVHAVGDRLSAEQRRRVELSIADRAAIEWVDPHALGTQRLPSWGRMPPTVYQKLLLADWLPPEIDRALWLDCDLVVLADLAQLWRHPLGDAIVGAVADELVASLGARFGVCAHRELGLDPRDRYFNAGVLLVDLPRWRAARVSARCFDYLERHRDRLTFWDQEALNAVLAGAWKELGRDWNRNASLRRLERPASRTPDRIVHYCGRLKPWLYPDLDDCQIRFFAHVDETAWRGARPRRVGREAWIARYARSPLRRFLFPAEQWGTALLRLADRWRIRLSRRRPS
jgi:lipopolysaccharide biosynthesis glycosyltransferase